jgi:hypothetical protein
VGLIHVAVIGLDGNCVEDNKRRHINVMHYKYIIF